MKIQMLLRESFAFLVTIQKDEKSVLLKMLIYSKLNIKLSGMSRYIKYRDASRFSNPGGQAVMRWA